MIFSHSIVKSWRFASRVWLLSGMVVLPVMSSVYGQQLVIEPRHAGHKPTDSKPKPFTPPALTPGYFDSGDVTPNETDTSTGVSSGGLPYSWTVGAAADYSASFDGIVGARSWQDSGLAESDRGRVRSSRWVAIELRVPAEITVTVSRKESVSDFLHPLPGGVAGGDLEPAFTLFKGWQEEGSEGDTFHNKGAIDWAPDLEYIDHVPNNSEAGSVSKTFSLKKGKYTVAIGGADETGPVLGRQGFEASIDFVSLASPAAIGKAKKRYVSKKSRAKIKGLFLNHESAALLAVQQSKKTKTYGARGPSWSAKTKRLKRGTNYVFVAAVSLDGTVSRWKRIKIIRK